MSAAWRCAWPSGQATLWQDHASEEAAEEAAARVVASGAKVACVYRIDEMGDAA